LYSDADISRLRKLRQAVDRGHAIGQAAKLTDEALDEIASKSEETSAGPDVYATVCERFLEAIEKMDVVAADLELSRAATLFPAHTLTTKIIAPILTEIGERWAHQEYGVAHEHIASGLLRNLLSSLIRLYPQGGNAGTIVLAAPATERHEFGLLLAALLAVTRGWRLIYLGVDLPSREIDLTVRLSGARVLALSVATHSSQIEEEFESLAQLLPGATRVWVGGAGAGQYKQLIDRAGWSLVGGLEHLDDRLRK
jgi:methanogenic corrinoid protein MtbC1